MDATILIYTYKEGLLSKLAHDLRLTVTRFEIIARGTEVTASIAASSLRIDGVMKDGRLFRDALGGGDLEKIRDNMRDTLRLGEHPEVRFVGRTGSREPPFSLSGTLTLAGVTQPFSTLLTLRDQRLLGDVEIVPSQWGIKPFRALGGALRVQDRVRVRIDASATWLDQAGELNPAVELVWQPATSTPERVKVSSRPPGS
ncbi:MAG: YceI family protein [Polyangiales bacterium]